MKEGIHPNYQQTTIRCACGNVIETGSTKKDIKSRAEFSVRLFAILPGIVPGQQA